MHVKTQNVRTMQNPQKLCTNVQIVEAWHYLILFAKLAAITEIVQCCKWKRLNKS
jgi:hypothetical protein